MNKYFLLLLFLLLLFLYFLWGISQSNKAVKLECEKEIILKEKEVIKYVYNKKAYIYANPNSTRSELLELMHEGKL